jgi:predicted Zn-dependent protease
VEAIPNDKRRVALSLLLAVTLAGCTAPTIQDEEEIGRQQATALRQQIIVLHDDVTSNYIDDLGQRLVHAAGPQPFEYTFTVVQDDVFNAQAGFGGQIYVNTGLITRTRNVSELAGVIGHEIGHVVKRHMADNYARAKNAGLLHDAAVIGGMIGGINPGAIDLLGDLALMGILNGFTREAEQEADAFAVDLLPRAGYDPEGVATMFEQLAVSEGSRGAKFFSDHPTSPDRVKTTRELIAAKNLPANLKRDDNGKLEIIQQRIRLLTREPERPRRR